MVASEGFSNLQLDLLKLYSTDMKEDELKEIELLLAEHFASKAVGEADALYTVHKMDDSTMDDWLEGE